MITKKNAFSQVNIKKRILSDCLENIGPRGVFRRADMASPDAVVCKNCGADDNKKGALFCHKCGDALPQHCPQCGGDHDPKDGFCPFCGHKFDTSVDAKGVPVAPTGTAESETPTPAPKPAPKPQPKPVERAVLRPDGTIGKETVYPGGGIPGLGPPKSAMMTGGGLS